MTAQLDEMTRLAIRHGTDKYGTHLYAPIYDQIFSKIRNEELRILEIGIGGYGNKFAGGLGLAMLAEYFPNSSICGLDIEEKHIKSHPRIRTVKGSQADLASLDSLMTSDGPFDIIIDDGSHIVDHVTATFRHLYPRMSETGVYLVEDTQTSFWPSTGGSNHANGTIFDLASKIAISMHADEVDAIGGCPLEGFFGNITSSIQIHRNIIAFFRGCNCYPSNAAFELSHRNVQQVRGLIEKEAIANPSAGSYLSRIEMDLCAGSTDTAVQLAREVVNLYPFNQGALMYSLRVFDSQGLCLEGLDVARKLVALYPEDADAIEIVKNYLTLVQKYYPDHLGG
ncbi:hypothetical protein ACLBXJ_26705 [Methylobacterium mesophilicum]